MFLPLPTMVYIMLQIKSLTPKSNVCAWLLVPHCWKCLDVAVVWSYHVCVLCCIYHACNNNNNKCLLTSPGALPSFYCSYLVLGVCSLCEQIKCSCNLRSHCKAAFSSYYINGDKCASGCGCRTVHAQVMFHWRGVPWIVGSSFSSPHSAPCLWYRLILVLSILKAFLSAGTFTTNCNPALWGLFLICHRDISGFFFTIVRIISSGGFPCPRRSPLQLMSPPLSSLFLMIFHTVESSGNPEVWPMSLMVLFLFFSFIMASLTFISTARVFM